MSEKKRSAWPLLIVLVAFMLPFGSAVVMRFGGWQPAQTRNVGDLLSPPVNMQDSRAKLANGETWVFVNQVHEWSLLARSADDCDSECRAALEVLPNVRTALGRHAKRLHLFQLNEQLASDALPALRLIDAPPTLEAKPARGTEVWLVDPHGYLVLHYPVGFDPSGLRKDLSRLIR